MDRAGDFAIPVNNGFHLDKNYVGNHLKNYDSLIILSHFKDHPMWGFGGTLKNMSIGVDHLQEKPISILEVNQCQMLIKV